jgi:hypothetical protein
VKWTPEAGDPKVSAAFQLGWRSGQAVRWTAPADGQDDERFPGLDASTLWDVLTGQIADAQKTLAAGQPALAVAAAPLDPAQYQVVLKGLYVTDATLGKACELGYALQDYCTGGDTKSATLNTLLLALASKLPANAAHAVLNGLLLHQGVPQADAARLRRQGEIWRSFLAGDSAAKDVLHLSDYVGTADEVVGRVQELARRSFKGRMKLLLAVVLVLVVAGVAALIGFRHAAGGVAAGAASLIAAFGLSWKAIGQFFGRAVGRAEQSLWDAQMDWTIAYRATLGAPAQKISTPDQRLNDHVNRWVDWQKDWPNTELDA